MGQVLHECATTTEAVSRAIQNSQESVRALACRQNDIEHRLTKPNHHWTNGQVERMNRTLKEASVKRYHYDNHNQFKAHLQAFMDA